MSDLGLLPEDFAEDEQFFVWPDNWQAVMVFNAMSTQWRTGPSGATGLDYSVLPEIWRRTKTPVAQRDEVFEAIRILEDTALTEMRRE